MSRIGEILKGNHPVDVFDKLNSFKPKSFEDQKLLFESVVIVWEHFEKEKQAGRLHYRPGSPEDLGGLTGHIELSGSVLEGKTAVQFNARSPEHIFTFAFDKNDWTAKNITDYLNRHLKYNSREYIQVKEPIKLTRKPKGSSLEW